MNPPDKTTNPPDKPTNPPDKSTNPPDKSTNPVTVFSKMCYPAQYFIILSSIYLFYSLFVRIRVQNKFNLEVISITLIILSLIVITFESDEIKVNVS